MKFLASDLLVSGDATVHRGVDDSVERHAEQVDVAVQLLVLVLADQRPQLVVLVLHHRDGVFQRTHLDLQQTQIRPQSYRGRSAAEQKCVTSFTHQLSLVHLKPARDAGQRVSEDQSGPLDPKTLKQTSQSRETH